MTNKSLMSRKLTSLACWRPPVVREFSDEMKWILKILLFFGVALLGLKLMGSVVTYRDAEPQQKL